MMYPHIPMELQVIIAALCWAETLKDPTFHNELREYALGKYTEDELDAACMDMAR